MPERVPLPNLHYSNRRQSNGRLLSPALPDAPIAASPNQDDSNFVRATRNWIRPNQCRNRSIFVSRRSWWVQAAEYLSAEAPREGIQHDVTAPRALGTGPSALL